MPAPVRNDLVMSNRIPGTPPPGDESWMALEAALPPAAPDGQQELLLEQEVDAVFQWYNRQATRARKAYQVLRVLVLVTGATVTVLAASAASPILTASLAAAVVVLEGLQQVFQFQKNWISYRSSAEGLRFHWFLYAARRAPYDDDRTRADRLAQVMREVTTKENAGWGGTMLGNDSGPA